MTGAEQFIAILGEKDLIPPEVLEHLRRQVAADRGISAALLAKWLVDRGHLTPLLAERLLSQARASAQPATPPQKAQFGWEQETQAEGELGLAPLDDEITSPAPAKRRPAPKPPPPSQPAASPPAAKPGQRRPEQPAAPGPERVPVAELISPGPGTPPAPGIPPAPATLEGLAGDSSLTASATGAGGALAPIRRRKRGLFGWARRRKKPGKRDNVWDSPLLLIGGGALLLLLIAGSVLLWRLRRMGAEDLLKLAIEDYRAGSYTQAIAKFDDYLQRFSGQPESDVSRARVLRGLARLRQATDHTSDWPGALRVADEVLKEIAQEEEFNKEARPEMVAMLPKIADGLAGQARADLDAALVQKTEEALALINKYIPSSSRPGTKIAEIEALLALTNREIARGRELDEAVAAMTQLVKKGSPAEAYAVRTALLKRYPELIDNEGLRQAVLAASRAELPNVRVVEKGQPAEATESPPLTLATLVFARRDAKTVPPGAEGRVIYALAEGAAYGLDATSGKILWRRAAGFAANGRNPSFPPTAISERAGSDAIMVDADRNEVLRVEATSGRQGWRHAVGEPFDAHPVVADDRLLVATRSGRLVLIDLETGDSSGYVKLPQELRVAPTVDFRRSSLYQVAEHSNLFVLNLTDGRGKQVVYLGHEPGSVTVRPVVIDRYLVVAENDGVDYATLRVLSLDAGEEDEPPVQVLQSVRVKGHVDVPPQVSSDRMLVATDRGQLYLFEIIGTDTENPLDLKAETTAASDQTPSGDLGAEGLIRFPLLEGGQVWIADSQLTRYDFRPTQGRLQPRGIQNERSVTLQPPVMIGQTVFHVRRRLGVPGVLVSAIGPEEAEPLWETHLATPLAAEPVIDTQAGRITVVTSVGAIYHVEAAGVDGVRIVDEPTLALKLAAIRAAVTETVQLEDGMLAMAVGRGAEELPVFDPQQPKQFRRLFLPGALGGPPIAFAGGLLAPCQVGQVFLLDPRSGDKLAEPFQPPLESGARVAWSRPMPVGPKEFLLAEGRAGLYRIGVKDQPRPHLAMLAQADLGEPLISPLAVVGQVAYAVDAAESLVAFELPDLTPGRPQPLGAKSVWGPAPVGERVLLTTDDDRLHCLDANQKIVWQTRLPYGPLAGPPLALDGSYVLAAVSGVIWRVDPASGKELAKVETGSALGTGPVSLGDQLLVGGHDGTLYKVPKP